MTQLPPDGGDLTDDGVIALRLALVAAGFNPLPEFTSRKFGPGDWRERQYDPALSHVGKYGPLLNTALRLTHTWAIDIDVDQPNDVDGILAVARDLLGISPCMRYRANSARRALLYRDPAPDPSRFRCAKGSDGGIEVFSGPSQKLTSFGWHTHKETKLRSRMLWDGVPGNVAHSDLPAVSVRQIDAFLAACSEWVGADTVIRVAHSHDANPINKLADDIESLVDAMAYVENAGPLDWHAWNAIGMALYAGSAGDPRALRAWSTWTGLNPHTRHRDCAARWQAYVTSPPSQIGAGSIFHKAIANGYRPLTGDARVQQIIETKKRRTAQRINQSFKARI